MSEAVGVPPALRRRRRWRSLGVWLQCGWILGPIALIVLTAAGVVRGGPAHPGMPLAWTPLVSIITGVGVGLIAVALLGTVIRLLAAAGLSAVAARPPIAAALHHRAAEPPVAGERFGRWRLQSLDPPAATPVPGSTARRVIRIVLMVLGIGLLIAAAVALPAVLRTRGGGADLIVTAVGGLILLGLAARRGPQAWRCATDDEGEITARVVRRGGGRPGRRRLIVRRFGHGHVATPVLEVDLPGWPESAVQRCRLAGILPPDLAAAVRGDHAGAVPGDRGLPPAPVQSADSASSDAITPTRSVRGS